MNTINTVAEAITLLHKKKPLALSGEICKKIIPLTLVNERSFMPFTKSVLKLKNELIIFIVQGLQCRSCRAEREWRRRANVRVNY